MKAILVASIDDSSRLYYVIDATNQRTNGVVDDGKNPRVVNFWNTAINARNLVPLRTGKFHDLLWDGLTGESPEEWERIFLNKTQKLSDEMTSGIKISSDVMKSSQKKKSLDNRAFNFKTLLQTQNASALRNMIGRQ